MLEIAGGILLALLAIPVGLFLLANLRGVIALLCLVGLVVAVLAQMGW